MEVWNDSHLDDCGMGAHQDPSLHDHGSSLSDAGVMECIYPPLKNTITCQNDVLLYKTCCIWSLPSTQMFGSGQVNQLEVVTI